MKFSLMALALAVSASAQTTTTTTGAYTPCPKAAKKALCCSASVLKLASLDCRNVGNDPTSAAGFQASCAQTGGQATCCVVEALGLGLLCSNPDGITDGRATATDAQIPNISNALPGLQGLVGSSTTQVGDLSSLLPGISNIFNTKNVEDPGIVAGLVDLVNQRNVEASSE